MRILVTLARPGPGQAQRRALYLSAVSRPGVEVYPVFPGEPLPDDFDALLLTGGEDVHPTRYRASIQGAERIDSERDELELAAVDRALRKRVPVLGVCRGFQVLNVALGGTLAQHVEGHRGGDVSHEIVVAPRTMLEAACGRGPFRVNSWHHQAVRPRDLARGLVPTVVVDDLIEGFEAPHLGWVVAVQWHPERTAEVDPSAARIFDAFVAAANPAATVAR
jgi:putative glutamine amidotransferase